MSLFATRNGTGIMILMVRQTAYATAKGTHGVRNPAGVGVLDLWDVYLSAEEEVECATKKMVEVSGGFGDVVGAGGAAAGRVVVGLEGSGGFMRLGHGEYKCIAGFFCRPERTFLDGQDAGCWR